MAGRFDKAIGSATLKAAGKVNKERANTPKVEMIDVSLLDENPDNEIIFNMDEIDRLAESIKADGFRGAVDVFKKPDGRYEISSGHRRVRAAKKIGLTEIPCFINAMPDDVVRARKLLDSNITNRVLKPLDYARAIEYYINYVLKPSGFKGQVNKECASYFGISSSNVYRFRALLTMDASLQALADDVRFPYTAFASAHRLSKESQKKLAEELLEYSNNNRDEDGNPSEVGRSYIENEIREMLKSEDNYKESQNKDIAKKHKENQAQEQENNKQPSSDDERVVVKTENRAEDKVQSESLEDTSEVKADFKEVLKSIENMRKDVARISLDDFSGKEKDDVIIQLGMLDTTIKNIMLEK